MSAMRKPESLDDLSPEMLAEHTRHLRSHGFEKLADLTEGIWGVLEAQQHEIGDLGDEAAALRRRIADLSNACEAAFNQLERDNQRFPDPDREVCATVLYQILNTPDAPGEDVQGAGPV